MLQVLLLFPQISENNNQKLTMGYVVTAASCHDRITTEKAMSQLPHPYEFGDKGYASKLLQEKLMRVNMALPFELRFAGINVFSVQKNGNNGCTENAKSRKPLFSVLVDRSVLSHFDGCKQR
jgi:hypothetical protein